MIESLSKREPPMSGWSRPRLAHLALILGMSNLVPAQLYTACNPLLTSCPPAPGFSSQFPYLSDFKRGPDDATWTSVGVSSEPITYSPIQGATFTVKQSRDNALIESDAYIFFGTVEVHLKAAPGQGLVSCVVVASDDLNEIDWEWLGGAEHRNSVQTNYFGKGETGSFDRGGTAEVDNVTSKFHNYTIDWDPERILWFIDGREVRRLNYGDTVPVGGRNYPQTPARVRIGLWAGGDKGNPEGTVKWAGGETDYSQGPFRMEVGRVRIVNRYPAMGYWFGDFSGRWESVVGLEEYEVEEKGVGYEWNGRGEDGRDYAGGGNGGNGGRAPGAPGVNGGGDGGGIGGGKGGDGVYGGGGGGGGPHGASGGHGTPGSPGAGAPAGHSAHGAPGAYGTAGADGAPAVVSLSGSSSLVKVGMVSAMLGSLLALGFTLVVATLA